jgi:hypothetical protein
MSRRLDFKLIFSLTILIVAISCISGYLSFRMQKDRLVEAMVLGADQLSRSITSATWHAMLDDDRKAAYEQVARSWARSALLRGSKQDKHPNIC